ncbi:MAG: vWA domain-containing protein [Chitinophagaceae bacterium]
MKTILPVCLSLLLLTAAFAKTPVKDHPEKQAINDTPRIQVAVLLDVSNSMDGLIEQAKTQLWSMVETLGKASCQGLRPKIEIALYEYGRPGNGAAKNFIKQIRPFTTDLDELSAELFKIRTDGGDEYCGAVMVQALNELAWDADQNLYKVIFIAGNESFKQGSIDYTEACKIAKQKGVVLNTIYCGDYQTGITEFWNLAGQCGSGTYSNINQDAKMENIPAPQDSFIYALNTKLNGSYVTYNSMGKKKMGLQAGMDLANNAAGYAVGVQRASVKAKSNTYTNTSWDLVDAYNADSTIVTKLDKKFLPDEVKDKSNEEIKRFVEEKNTERGVIQKQITSLVEERGKYIAKVRAEQATRTTGQTLENTIQTLIRSQAGRFHISFDK